MIYIAVMNVGLKINVSDGFNQASVFRSHPTLSLQPIFRLSKTRVESPAQEVVGGKTMTKIYLIQHPPSSSRSHTPSSITAAPWARLRET